MGAGLIFQIIFGFAGGLGLFLLGMKQMSEGMQAVAGEKIRKLISSVTDNRFVACGVGAAVTSLIQSSSVTTVMIVGMVNAGLMTLKQAIGVIMGADIGTTITAWLITLKIAEYGLPILGISAFFYLFSNNDRIRYTAMMTLGLGMVFFGLELMKEGFMPFRNMPEFLALMSRFKPTNYSGVIKCVMVGSFVTAIIQSSSATVAITITLARTGTIGYETAVALVLGENIGTTITAYLASLGTTTNAKRAALAHITIKVLGVMLMIPLFFKYVWFLRLIVSENISIGARIAFAHTGFNIIIVSIFISFIVPFHRFIMFLAPGRSHKEKPHLKYLDFRIFDAPVIAVQQSFDEIRRMGDGLIEMFNWLEESLLEKNNNKQQQKKIFHREKVFDIIQKEIVEFISRIMAGNLPHTMTAEARKQLRIADEYESISDYIVIILKLFCRMKNSGLNFTDYEKTEILELHIAVREYLEMVNFAVKDGNYEILSKARSRGDSIIHRVKDVRSNHLNRLESELTSPMMSLIYMDMLSSYRRVKDHALNVAEVLAGEK